MSEVALKRRLADMIGEYDHKCSKIDEAVAAFRQAGEALKSAACIGGEWGDENIDTGRVEPDQVKRSLRRSAWRHLWKVVSLPVITSAADKKRFEASLANPPPFTFDNVRASFGPFLEDPRGSILRGLAEVFTGLDPTYKSHEKVKIGVKGLPKRIILAGVNNWGGWGRERIRDVLNALAAFQGKSLITHQEIDLLLRDGNALREGGERPDPYASRYEVDKTIDVVGRGVWLKRYQNGNAHLYFDETALADINRALAEFYGDVLPDSPESSPRSETAAGKTDVAADLQFYPTPLSLVMSIIADLGDLTGCRVLEPSCGDGRFLEALREAGAEVFGVEVDGGRAAASRAKGLPVLRANFLEVDPGGDLDGFDLVLMNPPFFGKHYVKHVRHALRFLKPGGKLVAILPATARYDHGLLDDLRPRWEDLPVGAFRESGTNVCTTVATIFRSSSAA